MNLTPEKIELLKRTKPLDRATALGLIPESTFRRFAHQCRSEESAHAEVLPGPLANAFGVDNVIMVAGMEVRPIRASDWKLLKAINSPLYTQTVQSDEMIEAAKSGKLADFKGKDIDYTEEDGIELCFIFTRHPKDCRSVLAKGREVFRETAMQEFGDKVSAQEMGEVMKAVAAQAQSAFSTALKYEASNGEDAKKNYSPAQPG